MKYKMPKYEYINMDSGWSETFDEYGRWTYRKDLFPNGLKAVSDHLRKNGHQLGIYILPGIRKDAYDANARVKGTDYRMQDLVVNKREGNGFKGATYMPDAHLDIVQIYYDSLAELFAEWGVGFVKIDGCGPGGGDQFYPYQSPDNRECLKMLAKAFQRFNIWMELSWYMDHSYAEDWARLSNGARIFIDIESYSTRTMTTSHRVFQRVTQAARWIDTDVVGKEYGFFVDLDVVLVGMVVGGKCVDGLDNDDVRKTYISFWAIVSSVFCIGSDPRAIPDKYLAFLNHPGILEIHQAGNMARPIGSGNVWLNRRQIWWKRMPDGQICCLLFNAHTYIFMLGFSHDIQLDLTDVGIVSAAILDVWTGEKLGVHNGSYTARLRPGQCQMLMLTPM
ncbi:glycoside hydrolase superfamily [Zychaea mexicana]|uniref:glycoside hydrolase superfamily n=1 Tax=Zychaea mexicana TaxID=64656 RepID=UPI0022FEA6E2|nr:glycoside hydrolase superfamily [Zychaea mexicana]KAI9492834.1 glycoside hydrolase superfamily [Zychaea mexicana]